METIPSESSDSPSKSTPGRLVWVDYGKAKESLLAAHVVEESTDHGGRMRVKWLTTSTTEWLEPSMTVHEQLPSRRRQKPDFLEREGNENGDQISTPRPKKKKKKACRTTSAAIVTASPMPIPSSTTPVSVVTSADADTMVPSSPPSSSSSSSSSSAATAPDATTSNTSAVVSPSPVASSVLSSSSATTFERAMEVLSTATNDVVVKREGSASKLSPEERQRRRQAFEYWQKMNTDPDTGVGRHVFRRGCHPHCMSQILGGSGLDPWPRVTRTNDFVQAGDFFVAGNETWNPFGPRFPGDGGLVNTMAFEVNPDQTEFHLFVQCSHKPHERHWHGKRAAGGRMYVGVYKVPNVDEITTSIEFAKNTIPLENKKLIAEYFVKWDYNSFGANTLDPDHVNEQLIQEAQNLYTGNNGWEHASQHVKNIWIMLAWLTEDNYTMDAAPVEFVRFDETLYKALVENDCMNTSSLKDPVTGNKLRGRVELEAAALHQYF